MLELVAQKTLEARIWIRDIRVPFPTVPNRVDDEYLSKKAVVYEPERCPVPVQAWVSLMRF
jgi:hypothetical protein